MASAVLARDDAQATFASARLGMNLSPIGALPDVGPAAEGNDAWLLQLGRSKNGRSELHADHSGYGSSCLRSGLVASLFAPWLRAKLDEVSFGALGARGLFSQPAKKPVMPVRTDVPIVVVLHGARCDSELSVRG
jgi:hypothetical protein